MRNLGFFDVIDSEEKAYWLGFLAADGHVSKNGKYVSLQLARKDESQVQRLASLFDRPVARRAVFDDRTKKTYLCSRVILHSVQINRRLGSLYEGAGPLGTLPFDLQRHFLRGVFDGDGYVGRVKGSWRFTLCGGERFLSDVQQLLRDQLGLRQTELLFGTGIWKLSWGGVWALRRLRLYLYEGAQVWLDRKKITFDSMPDSRGVSQFMGVSRSRDRWVARMYWDGRTRHIASCDTEIEAARAYDAVARDVYGEKALVNLPAQPWLLQYLEAA